MVVNVYGLSFWVGEIVGTISGLSELGKGFVTAIPYAIAIAGLVLISRRSDRTGDRKGHIAVCLAVAAVAFIVSTIVPPVAAVAALAVGLFFLLGAHPVFWTMPAALLSGTAAAAGIALVNSIGNLGGFVGPYLVGLVKDATGSTDGGLIALAVILLGGSVLATRAAHDPALERAPREEARFAREGTPAAGDRVSRGRRTASSSQSRS
jgi:nitrate/nitrite transporter NarK